MRRGPAPKDPDQRARRNREELEWVDLGRTPISDAPALGKRPGGGRWLEATKEWWATWCRSPQATRFEETDWLALRMLALLVDLYHREPTPARMSEIRAGHSKLGATLDDRQRLRLRPHRKDDQPEVETPAADAPAERRLRKVSGDPRLELVQQREAERE